MSYSSTSVGIDLSLLRSKILNAFEEGSLKIWLCAAIWW